MFVFCGTGHTVVDGTVRGDHARRVFLCKSALLYWTGDYPAQSKVSCHHDKVLVHMAYTHTHNCNTLKAHSTGLSLVHLQVPTGPRDQQEEMG